MPSSSISIIKSKKQYALYQKRYEALGGNGANHSDEAALLRFVMQKWELEKGPLAGLDPIDRLQYLMKKAGTKQKDLVEVLGVSKGLVSDMLARKKGLSKDSIRLLAEHFDVPQEVFNQPYDLL